MSIPDDAFNLILDLQQLELLAQEIGNPELVALTAKIKRECSHVSARLTEFWEEDRKSKLDENVNYVLKKDPGPGKSSPW